MRFVANFTLLGVLALGGILFWTLHRLHASDPILPISEKLEHTFEAVQTFEKRLVVFGDSWSYNVSRNQEQGGAWTQWLCSMVNRTLGCLLWEEQANHLQISCRLENFAQAARFSGGTYAGSVINNAELRRFRSISDIFQEPLPDLRAQIDRWSTSEREESEETLPDEAIQTRHANTIFVVNFVAWDLWKLRNKPMDQAQDSVHHSIDSLFADLDSLSETLPSIELRIVLMMSVDVTFLPAFSTTSNQGGCQKEMASLVDVWNNELRNKAKDWEHGSIYLFDTNSFMLDQIRAWQFFAAGMNDARGLSKNEDPGWEDVQNPCVQNPERGMMGRDESMEKPCERPEKHLFW
jgi:HMG box factor